MRRSFLLAFPIVSSASMSCSTTATFFFLVVLSFFMTLSFPLQVEPARINHHYSNYNNPQITVMGMVYCDTCSTNSFSSHSYFLPGVEVRIECIFKAISTRTEEEISFVVNRTTNDKGIYKLEVASVDGVECAKDNGVGNSCRATLIRSSSSSSSCDTPAFKTTTDEISIKSRQDNMCIYSLNALSYRPSRINKALCHGK